MNFDALHADDYRMFAEEMRNAAQAASASDVREHYLRLAYGWDALATPPEPSDS